MARAVSACLDVSLAPNSVPLAILRLQDRFKVVGFATAKLGSAQLSPNLWHKFPPKLSLKNQFHGHFLKNLQLDNYMDE